MSRPENPSYKHNFTDNHPFADERTRSLFEALSSLFSVAFSPAADKDPAIQMQKDLGRDVCGAEISFFVKQGENLTPFSFQKQDNESPNQTENSAYTKFLQFLKDQHVNSQALISMIGANQKRYIFLNEIFSALGGLDLDVGDRDSLLVKPDRKGIKVVIEPLVDGHVLVTIRIDNLKLLVEQTGEGGFKTKIPVGKFEYTFDSRVEKKLGSIHFDSDAVLALIEQGLTECPKNFTDSRLATEGFLRKKPEEKIKFLLKFIVEATQKDPSYVPALELVMVLYQSSCEIRLKSITKDFGNSVQVLGQLNALTEKYRTEYPQQAEQFSFPLGAFNLSDKIWRGGEGPYNFKLDALSAAVKYISDTDVNNPIKIGPLVADRLLHDATICSKIKNGKLHFSIAGEDFKFFLAKKLEGEKEVEARANLTGITLDNFTKFCESNGETDLQRQADFSGVVFDPNTPFIFEWRKTKDDANPFLISVTPKQFHDVLQKKLKTRLKDTKEPFQAAWGSNWFGRRTGERVLEAIKFAQAELPEIVGIAGVAPKPKPKPKPEKFDLVMATLVKETFYELYVSNNAFQLTQDSAKSIFDLSEDFKMTPSFSGANIEGDASFKNRELYGVNFQRARLASGNVFDGAKIDINTKLPTIDSKKINKNLTSKYATIIYKYEGTEVKLNVVAFVNTIFERFKKENTGPRSFIHRFLRNLEKEDISHFDKFIKIFEHMRCEPTSMTRELFTRLVQGFKLINKAEAPEKVIDAKQKEKALQYFSVDLKNSDFTRLYVQLMRDEIFTPSKAIFAAMLPHIKPEQLKDITLTADQISAVIEAKRVDVLSQVSLQNLKITDEQLQEIVFPPSSEVLQSSSTTLVDLMKQILTALGMGNSNAKEIAQFHILYDVFCRVVNSLRIKEVDFPEAKEKDSKKKAEYLKGADGFIPVILNTLRLACAGSSNFSGKFIHQAKEVLHNIMPHHSNGEMDLNSTHFLSALSLVEFELINPSYESERPKDAKDLKSALQEKTIKEEIIPGVIINDIETLKAASEKYLLFAPYLSGEQKDVLKKMLNERVKSAVKQGEKPAVSAAQPESTPVPIASRAPVAGIPAAPESALLEVKYFKIMLDALGLTVGRESADRSRRFAGIVGTRMKHSTGREVLVDAGVIKNAQDVGPESQYYYFSFLTDVLKAELEKSSAQNVTLDFALHDGKREHFVLLQVAIDRAKKQIDIEIFDTKFKDVNDTTVRPQINARIEMIKSSLTEVISNQGYTVAVIPGKDIYQAAEIQQNGDYCADYVAFQLAEKYGTWPRKDIVTDNGRSITLQKSYGFAKTETEQNAEGKIVAKLAGEKARRKTTRKLMDDLAPAAVVTTEGVIPDSNNSGTPPSPEVDTDLESVKSSTDGDGDLKSADGGTEEEQGSILKLDDVVPTITPTPETSPEEVIARVTQKNVSPLPAPEPEVYVAASPPAESAAKKDVPIASSIPTSAPVPAPTPTPTPAAAQITTTLAHGNSASLESEEEITQAELKAWDTAFGAAFKKMVDAVQSVAIDKKDPAKKFFRDIEVQDKDGKKETVPFTFKAYVEHTRTLQLSVGDENPVLRANTQEKNIVTWSLETQKNSKVDEATRYFMLAKASWASRTALYKKGDDVANPDKIDPNSVVVYGLAHNANVDLVAEQHLLAGFEKVEINKKHYDHTWLHARNTNLNSFFQPQRPASAGQPIPQQLAQAADPPSTPRGGPPGHTSS